MDLYEIEPNSGIMSAFEENPKRPDINNAMILAICWSEQNPKGYAWLKIDSLEMEVIGSMPSYEERQKVIAAELGSASFRSLPNHIVILDDMAHMRDRISVNWVGSMLYARSGGPPGYIVGGNLLLVPRND